jgi:hypothetical protein
VFKTTQILFIGFTAAFLLTACGPSQQDAEKLGFANVPEMKEIQAKGFQTKEAYAKSLGFSSIQEMKNFQDKGWQNKQYYDDYMAKQEGDKKRKEEDEKNKEYEDNKQNIDYIASKIGGPVGAYRCIYYTGAMSEMLMKNGQDSYDLTKQLLHKYFLVIQKYKKEGAVEGDLNKASEQALDSVKQLTSFDQVSQVVLKCNALVKAAPDKKGGI